jgi:hypothetical protein
MPSAVKRRGIADKSLYYWMSQKGALPAKLLNKTKYVNSQLSVEGKELCSASWDLPPIL